jgi:cation transport protein ChaC
VFIANEDVDEYLGPQSLESVANVVAVAVGPSGKNSDYLLNLAEAMRTLVPAAEDEHLYRLESLVKEKVRLKSDE